MMDKYLIFEYLVFRLNEWKSRLEGENIKVPAFTKLRLQKILFLACAWNVDGENPKLLNVFDQFFALPYGPVEMDIYEAMKNTTSFKHICFKGNECLSDNLESSIFISMDSDYRKWIDEAVSDFSDNNRKYLTMPVFDLVELTHKWSVWQIAMQYAKLLGCSKEKITTSDIIESKKCYD